MLRPRTLPAFACGLAAAIILLAVDPGGRGTRADASPGSTGVTVSSRPLPLASDYTGVSAAGQRLLLIDYGNSPPRAAHGGICRVANVSPTSLRLTSVTRGSCDDPTLFGQHVMEVRQFNRGPINVRVATASSSARTGYTLGPVLFRYNQCSDCWDESIAGPRSLWIYAPISTTRGYRAGGELFRISERTGRLLQHWRMPSLVRSLLAVDADGLWIAPSIDTGAPNGLYHVAPGMRRPDRVLTIATPRNPGLDARFLVATGHTVWFETWLPMRGWIPRLYRLHDTTTTMDGLRVRGATPCTDPGEGPATVLGNAAGIYCVQIGNWAADRGATTQKVFRLSLVQRFERLGATVRPPAGTVDVESAADLDGSYYFLDPPTQTVSHQAGYGTGRPAPETGNAGRLFRVTR